jgi:hypothetical protein
LKDNGSSACKATDKAPDNATDKATAAIQNGNTKISNRYRMSETDKTVCIATKGRGGKCGGGNLGELAATLGYTSETPQNQPAKLRIGYNPTSEAARTH